MITRTQPDDWKDLQYQVARILYECGFATEVEKEIEGARGRVEIDVFAQEQLKGRTYTIVCECKNWRTRVPQSVIQGFRTIVADVGANIGYIISMAGFQSGAFTASQLTNIELLTWAEFQDKFQQSWFVGFMSPQITKRLDPLMTYTEPLAPRWFPAMSEGDQEEFINLRDHYLVFGMSMMTFTRYHRIFREGDPAPQLPIIEHNPYILSFKEKCPEMLATIPDEILNETSYREFLDASLAYGEDAIAKFRVYRDKYYKPDQGSE